MFSFLDRWFNIFGVIGNLTDLHHCMQSGRGAAKQLQNFRTAAVELKSSTTAV